jgi:hypothetical protein
MKTKWIEMTIIAYRTACIEIEDKGDIEASKQDAHRFAFDNCDAGFGWTVCDTKIDAVRDEEPSDSFCRTNDIEKFPLDH